LRADVDSHPSGHRPRHRAGQHRLGPGGRPGARGDRAAHARGAGGPAPAGGDEGRHAVTGASYVLDAVRTPIGRYGGALAGVRPDDLAATVLRALVGRHEQLDPQRIDDVFFGDANGAGEDNRNVARMALLLAGLPTGVPGVTVNRLCGSGLEAV